MFLSRSSSVLSSLGKFSRRQLHGASVRPILANTSSTYPTTTFPFNSQRIFTENNIRSYSTNTNFNPTLNLTEDQLMYYELAANFSKNEMVPEALKWDENSHFPVDVLQKAGELGFGGLFVREDVGGTGLSRTDGSIIFEALAAGCTGTTAYMTIQNMCAWMVDNFGTDEQREKYLPGLCSMQTLASYCLTEPGSGSDAASLSTKAELTSDGEHYILNGSKAFISGGGVSDLYVVMARTGEGPSGISTFLVEKGTPGLSYGANEKKMGWKVQPTSLVHFEDVKIPKANLVGKEGDGFKYAMKGLDGGRINIATCSVGAAQACLERTVQYVKERKQFGKQIAHNQHVQFRLAELAMKLTASRLMIRNAANLLDAKSPDATVACAMAKKFATDTGFYIINECLQLHGGYGYLKDYEIERYLRDARVHCILEGTNEVMSMIISRDLLTDK